MSDAATDIMNTYEPEDSLADHEQRKMNAEVATAIQHEQIVAAAAAALLGLFVGDALGVAGDGMQNPRLHFDHHGYICIQLIYNFLKSM